MIPTELRIVKAKNISAEVIKEHYPSAPMFNKHDEPLDLIGTCKLLFDQASYILKTDRYHNHIILLFKDGKSVQIIQMDNEDQADKYRTVREVAQIVRRLGIDSFAMISEMWCAKFDPERPFMHASEFPDRKERLCVLAQVRQLL